MTLSTVASRNSAGADCENTSALWEMISPEFLREMGWSAGDQTLAFHRDHHLLGWPRRNAVTAESPQSSAPRDGSCPVDGCPVDRPAKGRYCTEHRRRWAWTRRLDPDIDELAWRTDPDATEPTSRVVSLHGLAPLLVAQILYGLQARNHKGSRTRWHLLDRLCQRARDLGAHSIEQLPLQRNRDHLTATIQTAARRALLHPDSERLKDTWDMAAFGLGGYLHFADISQLWLRNATKRWAFDYLPTRGGSNVTGAVQSRIIAVARLSDSLRLQRDDGGVDFTRLGGTDITAFCNRMAFLHGSGEITARLRLSTCRMVKVALDGFRVLGLTRAGQCLAGLPEDFVLRRGQIPDEWDDDEAGKDLPAEVMRVICDGLPLLEQRCGTEARTVVELLIDTGRRPGEICQLRLDCLEYDADSQPILVYDNIKSRRPGRRLPIATGTADVIAAQQARIRARYPRTPAGELTLLPSAKANPEGRKGLSTTTLRDWHRRWLGDLPAVTVATETTVDDRAVAVLLPYDMATVNVYAYRHSYAQRHADAGARRRAA